MSENKRNMEASGELDCSYLISNYSNDFFIDFFNSVIDFVDTVKIISGEDDKNLEKMILNYIFSSDLKPLHRINISYEKIRGGAVSLKASNPSLNNLDANKLNEILCEWEQIYSSANELNIDFGPRSEEMISEIKKRCESISRIVLDKFSSGLDSFASSVSFSSMIRAGKVMVSSCERLMEKERQRVRNFSGITKSSKDNIEIIKRKIKKIQVNSFLSEDSSVI